MKSDITKFYDSDMIVTFLRMLNPVYVYIIYSYIGELSILPLWR